MLSPNDLLKKKFSNNDEKLIETMYLIMKTFGYTLSELKKIPIPTFFYLIKMMNKEAEMQKKSIKRGRR